MTCTSTSWKVAPIVYQLRDLSQVRHSLECWQWLNGIFDPPSEETGPNGKEDIRLSLLPMTESNSNRTTFPHTHTHTRRVIIERHGVGTELRPIGLKTLPSSVRPANLTLCWFTRRATSQKKQRRWWNAVRVIFSCTTSLSLSPSLSRFTLTLHFEYVGCRSWWKRDFHFLSSGWSSTARKVFLVLVRVYLL